MNLNLPDTPYTSKSVAAGITEVRVGVIQWTANVDKILLPSSEVDVKMNWTGGARYRIKTQGERKIQKVFKVLQFIL